MGLMTASCLCYRVHGALPELADSSMDAGEGRGTVARAWRQGTGAGAWGWAGRQVVPGGGDGAGGGCMGTGRGRGRGEGGAVGGYRCVV